MRPAVDGLPPLEPPGSSIAATGVTGATDPPWGRKVAANPKEGDQ
jgi:hypothetical protein